ncbi:MAG TPA: hypothetical protein VGO57_01510 [Verrucomicrobiae bacterium]|jgi:hypothetical protein
MRLKLLPLILLLAAGCATVPPVTRSWVRPAAALPADGFITQRAVFSARGAQFPFNGYLAVSASGGKRLVVTESFGHVIADVLVKPDGKIFVMQSSRMFPPEYIRHGVAADLECIFGSATNQACPVQKLSSNHFILKRNFYSLDLRIVDVKAGRQPENLFDETKAEKE